MTKIMKEILIIEDDIALCNGISLALKEDNSIFTQVHEIAQARQRMKEQVFDLIILDINLPDGNGLDFLREIRKEYAIPVILLTANDLEMDIVTGFELGADDYITKPFSLMVLRARVRAQLRKNMKYENDTIEIGPFRFSFERMEFYKDNYLIDLSKTEQKLLRFLIENRGKTLTRADLVDRIWTDGAEYVDENALSVTVKRLRDKLGDSSTTSNYIKTVHGMGYMWVNN